MQKITITAHFRLDLQTLKTSLKKKCVNIIRHGQNRQLTRK